MEFRRHQSAFADSLFSTCHHAEQDTASFRRWSYNAHDDTHGRTQSSTSCRRPSDCDREIDLQGLVSNILDETDSQDSFFTEGNQPTCIPLWSPNTGEMLRRYFQTGAKMQPNPTFPLNQAQAQSTDIDFNDFCQQSNDLAPSQPWLLPNEDRNSYPLRPQKRPPGLPMPNMENTYLSQVQQSKYDKFSDKDRGTLSGPNFPAVSDLYKAQSEIKSPSFHPYNEYHYFQSPAKSISNEQYAPQDLLVKGFQSLINGDHHHTQQSQIQSRVKPQMEMEKKMMHMSDYHGECFTVPPLPNFNMRGGDRKKATSQNFDHLGSMRAPRFEGENCMKHPPNTQQFLPLYSSNDPRRHSGMPIDSSNFSARSTPTYGSVPGMYMSANESAAFDSFMRDMMIRRDERLYSVRNKSEGNVIQLTLYLDSCYEQWRCLEKERKRADAILNKEFAGKWTPSVTNSNLPKTPPHPTRMDHLMVNQMREQARVASLLDRMEYLNDILHIDIHTALKSHHMAIRITQARQQEEAAKQSHQRQHVYFTGDGDDQFLVNALMDLAAATRKLRTALWCALQITLPNPVKREEDHVHREAVSTELDPPDGYSFKL